MRAIIYLIVIDRGHVRIIICTKKINQCDICDEMARKKWAR